MAFNVGELVAYLRIDTDNFDRGMAKAQGISDELDGKSVDVHVDAHTAAAETKLAEVAAAEKAVDDENKNVARSGEQAGRGMAGLVAAIVLLGPALVPVAAGVAGLTVGFGAMGAAGVLALVGIKQQMDEGTRVGRTYSGQIDILKGNLSELGRTAANGVLGSFERVVADLQARMPTLNGMIGEFSTVTGKAGAALVSGLVAGFIQLEPLARDAAVYILGMTTRFDALMSGPGVVSFGDYVRSVFPTVMQDLGEITSMAGHLVQALAPLGMGSLGLLRDLSSIISAIPTGVLSVAAQGATSLYLALTVYKGLAGPIQAVGTALKAVGVSAEVAETSMRGLTIASGIIGVALGIATWAYSAFEESQRKSTQAANDFADAIRADSGALGDNTRALAANKLQKSGLLDQSQQFGASVSDATDAVLGQAGGMAKLTAEVNKWVATAPAQMEVSGTTGTQYNKNRVMADEYLQKVQELHSQLDAGAASEKQLAEATAATTATLSPAKQAQADLAAKAGVTAAALANATTAQQTTAQAAADATAKMFLENDAAGLLKASLDALNGKSLGLMEAQTADAAATNTATDALKKNKSAIDGNSKAAVENQQALQRKVQSAQAEAEAVGRATGSSKKATEAYLDNKVALEKQLKAQGLLTPAVQAYIDKLYDVKNLKVPPTKLDVETADALRKARDLQRFIDSMHGKTMTITTIQQTIAEKISGGNSVGVRGGPSIRRAAGGWALGPGSSTSDSIDAKLSNGEFVVNAAAASRNRGLLEAINSGHSPSGGPVDLSDSTIQKLGAVLLRGARAGTDEAMRPVNELLTGLPNAVRQGVQ